MIDVSEGVPDAQARILRETGDLEVGTLVLEIDRLLVLIEDLLDESAA